MNFFNGRLVKVDGKYAAQLGGHTVVLPEEKQAALALNNVEEQDVTIGLRPEHIVLTEDEGVSAVISVHELMGSSVHLHVKFEGKDVIIVVNTMNMTGADIAKLSSGTTIKFDFGGNNCHVFSKETGINLEAAPVAEAACEEAVAVEE